MRNNIEVSNYIDEEMILDIEPTSKEQALEMLIEVMRMSPKIKDINQFRQAIFSRENLMSTGIGYGLAIPHARLKSIDDFVIGILRCKEGINYESIDDKPVRIIFMIGASETQDKDYIRLLSKIMIRLKDKELLDKLLHVETSKDIYTLITETE